jgi:hypothetical protein
VGGIQVVFQTTRVKMPAGPRLPADQDDESNRVAAFASTHELRRHGPTSYDAAYLEIAIRNKIGLATLDQDSIRAAKTENVTLLEPATPCSSLLRIPDESAHHNVLSFRGRR